MTGPGDNRSESAAPSADAPPPQGEYGGRASLRELETASLAGSTVALRVDFNVPLRDGQIADSTRIERSLPTIRRLAEAGAAVIVLSHLGRPGGRRRPELTLKPVARWLGEEIAVPVRFCPRVRGAEARRAVARTAPGRLLLLENTRFLPGETANAPELAAEWASWSDHFVLDAFGTAHRAHASTDGLPRAVRRKGGKAMAGLLVARELDAMDKVLRSPRLPFVAVMGGAKISGKIDVMRALLPRVDDLLVGGAMANNFMRALGLETGNSLVEEDRVALAAELLEAAGPRLHLPVDFRVADALEPEAATRIAERSDVRAGEAIGDAGPATTRLYAARIREAATILWNGPMGIFEVPGFDRGTRAVALAAADAADRGATVIVGGGDSAAAAHRSGVARRLTHISTGGGASLDLLAGKSLPGLAALSPRGDAPVSG